MRLVGEAIGLGWHRKRIVEIATFAQEHKLPVTKVELEQMVLADRWLVYRDQDFKALERAIADRDKEGIVHIWGDGSGTTFDKPAGIGVVIDRPWAPRQTISEGIGPGTNNRAELMAVWRGLKEVPDCCQEIVAHTDSEWTIGALTQSWSIQKNAELVRAIRKDLSLRAHPPLIESMIGTYRRMRVTFEHVKGHSGIEENELCDQLARDGRLGKKRNPYHDELLKIMLADAEEIEQAPSAKELEKMRRGINLKVCHPMVIQAYFGVLPGLTERKEAGEHKRLRKLAKSLKR